jgi:predicted ArsR family transcriptional regulator
MRGGLAILRLSLPDDEMSRRSFCQTLHCGKNRVDRALKELETSGLIHDKDGTNEPGAGRPSLNDLMTDELLPYLIPECVTGHFFA